MTTLRLIVPYGIDGASDRVARVVAAPLAAQLGESIEIVNRPGGGTIPGTVEALSAPADGNTLLFVTVTNWSIAPLWDAHVPYVAARDLTVLTVLGEAASLLTVPASLGVTSVAGLIALAATRPGELAYASAGAGQTIHLLGAAFARVANINMQHRPYALGSSAAYEDLGAGRVHAMFDSIIGAWPDIERGVLRALAVVAPQRLARLPQTPTLTEAGTAGIDAPIWFGFATHAQAPVARVTRLRAALQVVGADAAVAQALTVLGVVAHHGSLDDTVAASTRAWQSIIDIVRS